MIMMNKKILCIVVLTTLVLTGCGKGGDSAATVSTETERCEKVGTIILKPSLHPRTLRVSGNLQGYQTLNVSPSVQGKIEHIFVEVGDVKSQGEMLVRMDQTQYLSAKASMTNISSEKARMDELIKDGAVSQQSYDQVVMNYDQCKENLSFLGENTYYRAPFRGVITAKNYDDGDAFTGTPIVVLTQVNKLKTIIALPETYYPRVKKNMSILLSTDVYPEQTFKAFIEVVYPAIDPATHTFQCKVQVPNDKGLLKPGMYVTTELHLGTENIITVPYQSVEKLIGSNERYVFVVENGRAKRVSVKLGERYDEQTEIISSEIKEGVEYVSVGQHKLVDGVKITK